MAFSQPASIADHETMMDLPASRHQQRRVHRSTTSSTNPTSEQRKYSRELRGITDRNTTPAMIQYLPTAPGRRLQGLPPPRLRRCTRQWDPQKLMPGLIWRWFQEHPLATRNPDLGGTSAPETAEIRRTTIGARKGSMRQLLYPGQTQVHRSSRDDGSRRFARNVRSGCAPAVRGIAQGMLSSLCLRPS